MILLRPVNPHHHINIHHISMYPSHHINMFPQIQLPSFQVLYYLTVN